MIRKTHLPLSALALAALLSAGCSRVPPEEAVARGQAALAAGRYKEAAKLLDDAAYAYPENPVVTYNLGMARLLAGDFRAARAAFAESAKFAAGDERRAAVQGLAEAWRRAGNAKQAAEVYTEAIEGGDRSACLLAGLAGIELECGEIEAAHSHLSQAAADDRNDPSYLFNSGWLYSTDKKLDIKLASRHLALFIASGDNAVRYPAQAEIARKRLAALADKRSPELQEKIDRLLAECEDPPPGMRPVDILRRAREAYELDQSNAFALETFMRLAAGQRNRGVADALRARGRLLFPDDPAFRE